MQLCVLPYADVRQSSSAKFPPTVRSERNLLCTVHSMSGRTALVLEYVRDPCGKQDFQGITDMDFRHLDWDLWQLTALS